MGSTIPLLCASWVVAFESALEFREETSTFGLQERQNLHDTSDRAVQSVLASGSVCRKVIKANAITMLCQHSSCGGCGFAPDAVVPIWHLTAEFRGAGSRFPVVYL